MVAQTAQTTPDAGLRIDRNSLLAYKARGDQERQAALDELTRDAQEQGYGY